MLVLLTICWKKLHLKQFYDKCLSTATQNKNNKQKGKHMSKELFYESAMGSEQQQTQREKP